MTRTNTATMPQAKCDLNDALSHTRFAGRNRAQVVKILYQIATHLQYLNEQCHRIHGDLKPRNIVQIEVRLTWHGTSLDSD